MTCCCKPSTAVLASAALGGFLFGYDTAIVNGALFQLQEHFGFSGDSWQNGLVVSIAVAGAFLGSLVAGVMGSMFGRRSVILCADILFTAGSLLLAIANSLVLVWVGRAILGVGVGLASVIVPVYLAEMSTAADRGKVVAINNFFITGAQLIAAIVAAIMVSVAQENVGWRIMFGLGALPSILQLLTLVCFLPETPRYLAMRGDHHKALEVQHKFGLEEFDIAQVEAEGGHPYHSPTTSPSAARAKGSESESLLSSGKNEWLLIKSLFRQADHRKRLVVGLGLQLFQQLVGINTVMYYSAQILRDAGFKGKNEPIYWSVPLAATNAIFTLVALRFVDSWGRRRVLFISLFGCLGALLFMAGVGFVHSSSGGESAAGIEVPPSSSASSVTTETPPVPPSASSMVTGKLFFVALFLYLAFFAPGMGPIPWIINSEIYPVHLRSLAAGVATMANWAANALVSQLFPILMGSAIGIGGTFLLIAVFAVLAVAFVSKFVPETKGRTLEELERMFDGAADETARTSLDDTHPLDSSDDNQRRRSFPVSYDGTTTTTSTSSPSAAPRVAEPGLSSAAATATPTLSGELRKRGP